MEDGLSETERVYVPDIVPHADADTVLLWLTDKVPVIEPEGQLEEDKVEL